MKKSEKIFEIEKAFLAGSDAVHLLTVITQMNVDYIFFIMPMNSSGS